MTAELFLKISKTTSLEKSCVLITVLKKKAPSHDGGAKEACDGRCFPGPSRGRRLVRKNKIYHMRAL